MKGIPLEKIDYVLLDLDGTLLDKYFDDYFWEHLVPEKYAEKHDMTFGRAKEYLMRTYKGHEGTLKWTDLDFWSRELDLDVPALKEQIRHLIEVHPNVEEFLQEMKKRGKKIFLMTNAHYKSVNIKFKKTGIGKYFDTVVCSFEIGYPKEDLEFWRRTEGLLGYDRQRTLFIDDTEEILHTARRFGIKYVLLKRRASSRQKEEKASEFPSVGDFRELIPA
jgi:HAD superfamily hydrolase (TIGR01509 family)